jgi:hypothetical protein
MESYFKRFTVEYIEHNKNTKVLDDASVKTVIPEPKVINIIEGEY